MKLRLLTGLVSLAALGGCASYGYVDDGGGYYTGGSSTEYVYPAYGYGVYGYGSPYYRYNPGWSFGLGYGGGYGYPYYPAYRPPYHYPRPPYYHARPEYPHHGGRPDHGGPGPRPPVVDGNPPHRDRAPWRDLDELQRRPPDRGQAEALRPRRPGSGAMGMGEEPAPGLRPDLRGARPVPPAGYRITGPRSVAENQMRPAPAARPQRSMPQSAPRVSESRAPVRPRNATHDTDEP